MKGGPSPGKEAKTTKEAVVKIRRLNEKQRREATREKSPCDTTTPQTETRIMTAEMRQRIENEIIDDPWKQTLIENGDNQTEISTSNQSIGQQIEQSNVEEIPSESRVRDGENPEKAEQPEEEDTNDRDKQPEMQAGTDAGETETVEQRESDIPQIGSGEITRIA